MITAPDTKDPFVLDVRVITNLDPIDALCDCQTDDDCDPSCASACVSPGGPM